jgi:CBS domain-containing protein
MKKLRDIMTRDVETVSPTATVRHAAGKMTDLGLPALPVCLDGRLVGLLTDREMTAHIAAARRDPAVTLVRDIMDVDPAVLHQDRGLKAAERAMEESGTHRVCVVDETRRLVGLVSLGKIARADNEKAAGRVVRTISRPRKKATG